MSGPVARPVRDFDYHNDPEFLADPFAGFDKVRDERAFYSPNQGGYWVLTRYEDIREAYAHPEVFSSAQVSIPHGAAPRTLRPLVLDPPEHGAYRQPLAPLFSPPSVARREPVLRARCASILEGFAADGRCELLDAFARPFPTMVFVELMGLPAEDSSTLERWNHVFLHEYEDREARGAAAQSILGFLDEVVSAAERTGPGEREDVIATLLRTEVDGRPLTHDELLDYAFLLFIAGLDTVTATLGFLFHLLATRPELQQRLRDEPALIPAAVEEVLRARAIVNPGRVVTEAVHFAGVDLQAGDRVLLSTAMASLDPDEFDRPGEIVFEREGNRHLAFGAGPHRCLGSHLARLELRIAIEELHAHLPTYWVPAGEQVRTHGGGVLGIDRLPLEWDPA